MTEQSIRPRRSFIFSPGLRPELYPKALACGADIVCVELEDGIAPKGKDEARLARDLGFSGKGSIHPKQIPTLNTVFSPDAATVAYAKRIVAAFADADTGLVLVDGKLIERPVLRDMHRILAVAERIGG